MRTAFAVLLGAYTLSQFYRSFLAVVAGDLARDLSLDAAGLGSLSAAWFGAFAVAQFPVGMALDRFGPRRTLALGLLVAVAGAALLAGAGGFAGALVAMALIGVGCAPVLMASMVTFARTAAPARFAVLSSTLIGLGSVGNLLGATPLALLVAAIGWRPALGAIAAVTLLAAAAAALLLRDPPPVADSGAGSWRGVWEVVTIPTLWLLLPIVATSYALPIAVRALWIAPFLGQTYGLDVAGRGHAALAMGLAMSLGALFFGPLERVFGAKAVTIGGVAFTAAGFGALGLWGGNGLQPAVALLSLVGFAGTTYAVLMAHGRAFIPDRLLGRGVTFLNFAFIGGAGVAQWLSGLYVRAAEAAGTPAVDIYERLFLAFALLLALSLAVYAVAPARPREAPAA